MFDLRFGSSLGMNVMMRGMSRIVAVCIHNSGNHRNSRWHRMHKRHPTGDQGDRQKKCQNMPAHGTHGGTI